MSAGTTAEEFPLPSWPKMDLSTNCWHCPQVANRVCYRHAAPRRILQISGGMTA